MKNQLSRNLKKGNGKLLSISIFLSIFLPCYAFTYDVCSISSSAAIGATFSFRKSFSPETQVVEFNRRCDILLSSAPDWKEGTLARQLIASGGSEVDQLFANNKDLNKWCPNFNSLDETERRRAGLLFFKSLAQKESSCNQVSIVRNATNGSAYGLFQLETVHARLNAGRSDECFPELKGPNSTNFKAFKKCSLQKRNQVTGRISYNDIDICAQAAGIKYSDEDLLDVQANIACTKSILKKVLANNSGELFAENQYWEHLKKKGKEGRYCGGAIGAFTRSSLLQIHGDSTCISNINKTDHSDFFDCMESDLSELSRMQLAKAARAAKTAVSKGGTPPCTGKTDEICASPAFSGEGQMEDESYLDNLSMTELHERKKLIQQFLKASKK